MTHGIRNIALLGLSFALILCVTAVTTSELKAQEDPDLQRLFIQGVRAFEVADYEKAYDKFNEFLSKKPSSDLALKMREYAGYSFFVKALSADKDLAFVVKKILELAEIQVKIDLADEARIRELLDIVKEGPVMKRFKTMEIISSTIGHYVVPYCVEILGNRREDDWRVNIILLLTRLGPDAVLPVIQICDSPDSFTRENAAMILGHLGDERAVPILKKLWEDPREHERVKREAKISLLKLTNKDASKLDPAKVYYYRLAERYYYDDLSVVHSNYKDWVFWFWAADALHFRIVERFEYNELLAEDACYDGLALEHLHDEAHQAGDALWTLLICVYYAQLNEVQSALEVAEELAERGFFPSDKKVMLEGRRKILEKANVFNLAMGKRRIYRALARSLKDYNVLVAVSCIDAVRDLEADGSLLSEDPGEILRKYNNWWARLPEEKKLELKVALKKDQIIVKIKAGDYRNLPPEIIPPEPEVGNSLIAALASPDKRARYTAAECLVNINPKKIFKLHEQVIPTLINALGEVKPRVILVIEPDPEIRNRTKHILRESGYNPISEDTGINGLSKAKQFPTEDLIIVSTELPDLKAYEVIDALKHDNRTAHTPVIVTCPAVKKRKVEALYSDKCNGVLKTKEDPSILKHKVADIFKDIYTAQPDVVVRARIIAAHAAEALSIVDLKNPNFKPVQALDALIKTVQRDAKDDLVRNPALQAIGHLGIQAEKALPTLINVFNNRENTVKIRVNAANAIADILRPNETFSENAFKSCIEGMHEESLDIQYAASKVIGAMKMDGDRHYQVGVRHRIHKNVPK
jgi:HEAT repeat protein